MKKGVIVSVVVMIVICVVMVVSMILNGYKLVKTDNVMWEGKVRGTTLDGKNYVMAGYKPTHKNGGVVIYKLVPIPEKVAPKPKPVPPKPKKIIPKIEVKKIEEAVKKHGKAN